MLIQVAQVPRSWDLAILTTTKIYPFHAHARGVTTQVMLIMTISINIQSIQQVLLKQLLTW